MGNTHQPTIHVPSTSDHTPVQCIPTTSEHTQVESVPSTVIKPQLNVFPLSDQTPVESVPSINELQLDVFPLPVIKPQLKSVPSTSDQKTLECDQTPVECVSSTSYHTPVESVSCKYQTTQNTSHSHTTLNTCTAKDDDFPLSCVFVKSKLSSNC